MKMPFKKPSQTGGPRFQTGSNTAPNVIKPIASRASWRRAIADLSPRPTRLVLQQMERGSGAMQHQPILLAVATSVSARTPLHALIFHPPHCTSRRNTCKSSGGKHEAPRARRCLPPLFLPPFCRAPCAQLLSAMHLLRAAQSVPAHPHCSAPCFFVGREIFGDSMLIKRVPIFITVEISRARANRLGWWGFTRALA